YTVGNTATGDLRITNSTLENGFSKDPVTGIVPGGGGVTLTGGGAGSNPNWTYLVQNNDFSGARGSALTITTGTGAGNYTGTVSNNRIGKTGVTESASYGSGHGIVLTHQGTGTHKVQFLNNTVRQYGDRGIDISAVDGSPVLRVTLHGNVIDEPGDAVTNFAGLRIAAGALGTDNASICADIGGAGALKNSLSNSHAGNTRDIAIRGGGGPANFNFPGYGGGSGDFAALTAFLQPRNDGNGTPALFYSESLSVTETFSGTGTNCL
ncbi:MAG TPA: hypothetical protein VG318_15770, partial [Actinomycetota bacterium]|nr:hypothetical protein [Actinomycetota bacterium]